MRGLRRWLRRAVWALVVLAAIPLLYLAASLVGALVPASPASGRSPGEPERIYLATSLLHADFAIPATEEVKRRFAFLRPAGLPLDHPDLRYLVFGWGSRAFYIATPTLADIRPGPVVKGVFGDRSVMHVVAARDVAIDPGVMAIDLPPGGLERLASFIEQGFARDEAGAPVHIPDAAYGSSDAFFEGVGRFDIIRPCNIWVAEGLRRAGIGTGTWTPTTLSLRLGLQWHGGGALAR